MSYPFRELHIIYQIKTRVRLNKTEAFVEEKDFELYKQNNYTWIWKRCIWSSSICTRTFITFPPILPGVAGGVMTRLPPSLTECLSMVLVPSVLRVKLLSLALIGGGMTAELGGVWCRGTPGGTDMGWWGVVTIILPSLIIMTVLYNYHVTILVSTADFTLLVTLSSFILKYFYK